MSNRFSGDDADQQTGGWVKLWRKSISGGLLKNHKLWVFWCWCLLKASHRPCKTFVGYREVFLEAGQFVFGRKASALETGLTEQTIRTCLTALETNQQLTIKSTNKFSVITVCNWDTYQNKENQTNQQLTSKTTSKQPTTNQQLTNNQPTTNHKQEGEEVKEGKEVKNLKTPPTPKQSLPHQDSRNSPLNTQCLLEKDNPPGFSNENPPPKGELVEKSIRRTVKSSPLEFETFWQSYPRRVGKGNALAAWNKLLPSPELQQTILTAIAAQKLSEQWTRDGGQFIPHPATWLNGQRWFDEATTPLPKNDELPEWLKGLCR